MRKTVQNGSNRVKIGLQAAVWVPCWYQFAKFGLKKVPRDPFRPNLFAFLFKIGQNRFQLSQNGSKWVPKGSKRGQKRVNLYQNALNWVPSGLKWHQHPLKWVKTGSIGVQRGPTWPKGVKMASKWPQIPQNSLFQAKFA